MGTAQVICLKTVRAFEKGEQPAKTTENPDMDSFSKQLLSRAPDGAPRDYYRAAIEDTTIITMKGVGCLYQCVFSLHFQLLRVSCT